MASQVGGKHLSGIRSRATPCIERTEHVHGWRAPLHGTGVKACHQAGAIAGPPPCIATEPHGNERSGARPITNGCQGDIGPQASAGTAEECRQREIEDQRRAQAPVLARKLAHVPHLDRHARKRRHHLRGIQSQQLDGGGDVPRRHEPHPGMSTQRLSQQLIGRNARGASRTNISDGRAHGSPSSLAVWWPSRGARQPLPSRLQ